LAISKNNNKQQRTMEKAIYHSLEVLNSWAMENNMMNKSKTMYQFFSLRHKNTDFSPKTDDQMLQKSASTKHLGGLLDNKLNWADHTSMYVGGQERHKQGFGWKPEGKDHLDDPRHRWQDNIKINLQAARLAGINWIAMTQKRDRWQALVNVVMNLQVQ
jgi:hypothetical protein